MAGDDHQLKDVHRVDWDSRIFAGTVETVVIPSTTKPSTTPRCTTRTNHSRRRGRIDVVLATTPFPLMRRDGASHPRNRLPQAPTTCPHVPLHRRHRPTNRPTPSRRRIVRCLQRRMLNHSIRRIRSRRRKSRSLLRISSRPYQRTTRKRPSPPSKRMVLPRRSKRRRQPRLGMMLFLPLLLVVVSRG